jgi:hypothetical protein
MRALLFAVVFVGLTVTPGFAITYYFSPDAPMDDPDGDGTIYVPWDIARNDDGVYSGAVTLATWAAVNAAHRMCVGDWLLSVEAPIALGGTIFEPRDVVRFDEVSTYTAFFCGDAVGIPLGVDIDAAFLVSTGGSEDDGDLILSFDIPVNLSAIGGGIYDPADLVRFARTGSGCGDWAVDPNPYFDASDAGVPTWVNVTGADRRGTVIVLTFDVPWLTYLPGDLVSWDGTVLALFYRDPRWPVTSRADALAFLADPGTVPDRPEHLKIHLRKVTPAGSIIRVTWSASSSAGAEDYGIYEGALVRPWQYNHTKNVCTDPAPHFEEDITTQPGSRYYLVVALNPNDEGSYGQGALGERPVGYETCRPSQALGCP